MKNECLICNASLIYQQKDEIMQCAICHKEEKSKVKCENNHYICNKCHTTGIVNIINKCLNETSSNPLIILDDLMDEEYIHMHGPEHHIIVGASILTACKNANADINLEEALTEMINRAQEVPGGICGYWGACGAAISTGIAISILTQSTPLKIKEFQLSNRMTSQALEKVAEYGGPRCCKRDSYLSIQTAIKYIKEELKISLEEKKIICKYYPENKQCKKEKCPYYPQKN